MSVWLRPAHTLDAGKLGDMLTQAVHDHTWKPRLHSAAEDIGFAGRMIDRGWVTVAVDEDDRAWGFMARENGFIHSLMVARQARGHGLGTMLLEDAKTQADMLDLWTFVANTGARRFYERHGFVEVGRTDGDNEEGLPDIRFRWYRVTPGQDDNADREGTPT